MKIVHLTSYFQPQLGYQEYFLAREHIKLGHDVWVVTSDRYFPFPDYDKTVKNILGKRIIGSKNEVFDSINVVRLKTLFEYSARVKLKNLKKTIREISPDIVICHGMSNFLSLEIITLKKKLGFKLVYDEHMTKYVANTSFFGNLFYKFFNFNKILMNSDKIVGVADACVEYILSFYKFPKEKVAMIPLGADNELFSFDQNKRELFRKTHNIPYDNIVIVYTGKLTFVKGPHHILLAIKEITDKIPRNITILFVGNIEDNYVETFTNLKNELSTKYQIINISAVKNEALVDVYSASDIACWPRQGSMSMIEAASCGLPIICCDYLTERYKNNNGIPIKEDDIASLSDALLKLINDKELRKEMGKNGREYIDSTLSWKSIAQKFIEF
mgnify:CR=1 FL=1